MFPALLLVALLGCEEAAKIQADSAKATETRETMISMDGHIEMYRMKHKNVPRTLKSAMSPRPEPKDGWGHRFVYERPGPGARKWEIISLGADGEPGGMGLDADIKLSDLTSQAEGAR